MAPQNWDDDFDFEDDSPKKKPAQQKQKQKKKPPKDNDFFDDDQNTNKLPTISSKNLITKQVASNKKSSAKPNPYAENMKLRGNIYDDYEDPYQQVVQEPKTKNKNQIGTSSSNLPSSNVAKKKNQIEDDMDYYQQIDDEPKKQVKQDKKATNLKKQQPARKQTPKQQDNYEEEVFQDNYGDDFQQVQQQKQAKQMFKKVLEINTDPPKKKSIINPAKIQTNPQTNVNSQKKAPPLPPSRASVKQKNQAPPHRNLTVDKNPIKGTQKRSESRHSNKSAQSKRVNPVNQSRANSNKFSTNISFIPNKYTSQIQKSFPDENLSQLNQDKINKLNQKLRGMIKKFNQELNQLINKNMMYLKSKKQQKSPNVENKLRVMEQQSKNNETMIQVMQKQFDKLSGRDGQLRQQQYQLMMQKKIQDAKQQIKQFQKLIVKLKNEVKSQGNKLTNKNEDKKLAAQIHHIKTTLIQSKKDQQKNTQRIQKLEEQMNDLNQKITDIDYKLSQLYDQARDKGIQLQSKQELYKKFDMIKKKVEASKNHRSKLENLLKTKSDIISHQKQQLKINIKNCELQIKNLYDSISHVHNQSVKVVQKAKINPKLSPNIVADLDGILKSLEIVQKDNYSVRSEENRSQASNRPLKNIAIQNMQKSQPQKRSESANNDKYQPINANEDHAKFNLLKKKPKLNEMPQQKKLQGERVWKEDEKQKQKKQKLQQKLKQFEKGKQKQKQKEKQKQQQKVVQQQKDKKKPFTLKKNRVSDNKINENKYESEQIVKNQAPKLELQIEPKKQQQQKKQQISLAGPRMMKFKRKNPQQKQKQVPSQQQKPPQKQIPQTNKTTEQQQKNEEQKPIFAPKRFNLRNRQKKQQSYVPSIETKQKQQPKKQTKIQQPKNQQYKPKFNFGDVQDNFKKPAYDPFQKKQQKKQPISIPTIQDKKQDQDSKPKFNLRLRDRKKNTQQVGGGGYVPTIGDNKPEQKPMFNIAKQNNTNQNPPALNLAANKALNNVPKQEPKVNIQQSNLNTIKQQPKNQQQTISNTINNPYAPTNQGEGGRKKQGPIKKPKIQPQVQKQKINIYQQAQQAQGLNQFVNESKKQEKQPAFNPNSNLVATKDLNLNDLLGVKKPKGGGDDLADLLGGGNENKKAKKNNDFFGSLDL